MKERSRRFVVSAVVVLAATLALAYSFLGATRYADQLVPGPRGSVLHVRTKYEREYAGFGGPPHSGGGIGPSFEWRAASAELRLSSSPPRDDSDWAAWASQAEALPVGVADLWVDSGGRTRVSLGADSAGVEWGVDPEVVPRTCRSSFEARVAGCDLPIACATFLQGLPGEYSVTAFGAVEVALDTQITSQEWAPDELGRFTRWWQVQGLQAGGFSRYQPPFEFDRIDRLTSVLDAQTREHRRRFSTSSFLYRRGEAIVGIYWPNLKLTEGQAGASRRFTHTFGSYDAERDTIDALVCVDAAGGVWRFEGVGEAFALPARSAIYPHDVSELPEGPSDWLRYRVGHIEQLFHGAAVPDPVEQAAVATEPREGRTAGRPRPGPVLVRCGLSDPRAGLFGPSKPIVNMKPLRSIAGLLAASLLLPLAAAQTGSDDCSTADPIVGSGTFAFDTSNATVGAEGQGTLICYEVGLYAIAHDVWFTWTPDATGTGFFGTCGLTSIDTKLAAYAGAGCPTGSSALDCYDDTCGLQSELAFPVVAGGSYTLQLGTHYFASGGTGSFKLEVESPPTPGHGFCDCEGGVGPCGNSGAPGRGCGNGSDSSGALLLAIGSPLVGADTLILTASGLVPNQPGLFFQGDTFIAQGAGVPFGDGLRCTGGQVRRLGVVSADSGGASDSSSFAQALSVLGAVSAGDLVNYQLWYRDPLGSPCGAQFNLTNGYSIQW